MKSLSISHNITTFQWSLRKRSKSVVLDPRFHWNWFAWHFYYVIFFVCFLYAFDRFFFFLRLFYALPSHTSISLQSIIRLFVYLLFGANGFSCFDIFIIRFFFFSVKPMESSTVTHQCTSHLFLLCVEVPLSAKSLIVMRLFLLLSFAVEIFLFDAT